jgi:hypothetical protein
MRLMEMMNITKVRISRRDVWFNYSESEYDSGMVGEALEAVGIQRMSGTGRCDHKTFIFRSNSDIGLLPGEYELVDGQWNVV